MDAGLRFVKGHGTENDFVQVPDADGARGPLDPVLVRALCDRHAGLGADGVIRVVRTAACDDPAAVAGRADSDWFMDYTNSDGSPSEMCGNGVRVLGRYLVTCEGVDPGDPLPVATRAGTKVLTFDADDPGRITVDMGTPVLRGSTTIAVGDRLWEAAHVDMGNPHAVAFVASLDEPGPLLDPPVHDPAVYPDGVNVEFVVRRGPGHVAMRVHERGSGETRSCGTGACAVMVASALADGSGRGASYDVDLPGGTLTVTWTDDDRILMTGPAVLVAEGYWLAGR
jgi:diaminopimelate epimerase